jgi:hypothetical protein
MNKTLMALAASMTLLTVGMANAQVSEAASNAADAAQHKIEEKRAENDAKKSGPVGKAVNNVKAGYHKQRSKHSAHKAKKALSN